MKTGLPTLADIAETAIGYLLENELPPKGDSKKFFDMVKKWDDEPLAARKRVIFFSILKKFKNRLKSKGQSDRQNETWKAINTVLATWRAHKHLIFTERVPKKMPVTLLGIKTQSVKGFGDDLERLTFFSH